MNKRLENNIKMLLVSLGVVALFQSSTEAMFRKKAVQRSASPSLEEQLAATRKDQEPAVRSKIKSDLAAAEEERRVKFQEMGEAADEKKRQLRDEFATQLEAGVGEYDFAVQEQERADFERIKKQIETLESKRQEDEKILRRLREQKAILSVALFETKKKELDDILAEDKIRLEAETEQEFNKRIADIEVRKEKAANEIRELREKAKSDVANQSGEIAVTAANVLSTVAELAKAKGADVGLFEAAKAVIGSVVEDPAMKKLLTIQQ